MIAIATLRHNYFNSLESEARVRGIIHAVLGEDVRIDLQSQHCRKPVSLDLHLVLPTGTTDKKAGALLNEILILIDNAFGTPVVEFRATTGYYLAAVHQFVMTFHAPADYRPNFGLWGHSSAARKRWLSAKPVVHDALVGNLSGLGVLVNMSFSLWTSSDTIMLAAYYGGPQDGVERLDAAQVAFAYDGIEDALTGWVEAEGFTTEDGSTLLPVSVEDVDSWFAQITPVGTRQAREAAALGFLPPECSSRNLAATMAAAAMTSDPLDETCI